MNKKIILPLLMFIALAGIGYAAGTCTFNSPAASATISGSTLFNISTTNSSVKNCTVTGTSSANGQSWTTFTVFNQTSVDDQNKSNATVVTNNEYDAADWSFSATCVDDDDNTVDTCTRTGITVDNTVPTVGSCTVDGSSASNTSVTESTFNFVCTLRNATTGNVYWKDTSGVSLNSGSDSDTSCSSFTFSSTFSSAGAAATCTVSSAGDDSQTLYMDAGDGTNTTNGVTYGLTLDGELITIDEGGHADTDTVALTIQKLLANKLFLIIAAAALFGIILIAVAMMNSKK